MDYTQILNFIPQDLRDLAIILLFAFIVWKLSRTEKEQKAFQKEREDVDKKLVEALNGIEKTIIPIQIGLQSIEKKLESQKDTNKVTYANKEEIISLNERVSNVEKKVDEIDEKVK